jgi:hypothetical protein
VCLVHGLDEKNREPARRISVQPSGGGPLQRTAPSAMVAAPDSVIREGSEGLQSYLIVPQDVLLMVLHLRSPGPVAGDAIRPAVTGPKPTPSDETAVRAPVAGYRVAPVMSAATMQVQERDSSPEPQWLRKGFTT